MQMGGGLPPDERNTLMEIVSKRNRWRSALGMALALPLLVGGCSATPDNSDEAAQTQPSDQTAPGGFVGVGADGESMNQFPDNGVKNDGYGSYLQSTVADDDPALKLSRNLVEPRVWNAGFTEEQITAGQAAVVRFIATEGIDSTLRAPHNEDNQQVWDEWVAANKDKFSDLAEFGLKGENWVITPDDLAVHGWPNGDPSGPADWKSEIPFEYQYGEDKMRVVNRTIVPGAIKNIEMPHYPATIGVNAFIFEGTVSYAIKADINGAEGLESDEVEYRVEAELTPGGEWKFYRLSMSSLIGQ